MTAEQQESQLAGGMGWGSQESTAQSTAHGFADKIAGAAGGWKKPPPGPSLEDIAGAAGRGAAGAFQQQQQQQQQPSETGTPPAEGGADTPPVARVGIPSPFGNGATSSSEETAQPEIAGTKPKGTQIPLTASMKKAFGIRSK